MISAPVVNVDKIELLTVTSNNYDGVFMTCNLGSFTSRLCQHKSRGGVGRSTIFQKCQYVPPLLYCLHEK